MDRHLDGVVTAGERLINRVVNNLVDEVMQAALTGRSDVHAGALAYGLQPFQHLDVLGVVTLRGIWGAQRRLRSSTILRLTLRRPDRKKTAREPGRQSLVYRRIAQGGP